jgi:hypothetical protein
MEKRRQIKKETQKKRKKNIINKSINLNSDSDSEDRNPNESNRYNKIIHQRKNKINNNDISFNKNNNNKYLGNKIKGEKIIEDDYDNIKKEDENMYRPMKKIKKEEDDNMVEFPYEFTERLIDALSCFYCQGIYIRPYVINITGCGHIFCLGCITKMLENGESGICPKCKNHFTERNIKYSEVTDYYINTFFPEIPKIIAENKTRLNNFMIEEGMKYNENRSQNVTGKFLKCEIFPFKENVPSHCILPEINDNKFMIKINSENDNVLKTIKGEVIRRLKMKGRIKEEDIEIRLQGADLEIFDTFKKLKNLQINLKESNEFFYCKVNK